ncbi:hypothetical protein ES705_10894 [subsurface metagenome]
MAIISEMPGKQIIDGFRGNLDFYYWKGLPICRSWPQKPKVLRIPSVRAGWPSLTAASREWKFLSPRVQASYNELTPDSGLSGRDFQVRAYMSGLYRYPTP